ncbi:hypothetical protein [Streptomyces beihaiensis]|uniref:Uncharacterized protein n=1 Tax=Streptomyces beihaiensis TaxID=2984495 RepID=A0ABT3U3L6_9ACTN|nr:hypothetical protein [Streptomyces beihaiensis]MCX3063177.1 hypothetical protein [Streptomyces beihaiensis]
MTNTETDSWTHSGTDAETTGSGPDADTDADTDSETDAERRRRRALFLRELTEARELRARVQPRRARAARMRQHMRMRTFRW